MELLLHQWGDWPELYRNTDKTEATEIVIIDSQMNYRGKLDTYGAKAPSSICLQYRLYTDTQKVYESIPFISLNFSFPHPWPAPLHPTPWGFPAFPVFEDIQGIYEKEICPLKNKKILPEREGSILSYMGPRNGGIQRVHHGTHRRCEGSKGGGALWGADFKERGRGWRRRLWPPSASGYVKGL